MGIKLTTQYVHPPIGTRLFDWCCFPTGDDDWTEYEAFDAEDAAETHAEHIFNNCDGWEYMPNNSTPILVKDGESKTLFSVYTEFYPSFSARKRTA